MNKYISTALAAAIALTSTVSLAGAAEARNRHHDRYERQYNYERYNGYDRRHYRRHHSNGNAVAAGVLGFALGAIVAGTAQNNHRTYARRDYYDARSNHVARCEQRYRSYDRRTDTFIGRDGREYYCDL